MGTITPSKQHMHTAECPACGSDRISEREKIEYFEYGSEKESVTLSAVVPLLVCAECGEKFTDERGEHARHASVCAHLNILEPDEIIAIRQRNNMTQTEFSATSRIGRASLTRWESGAVCQNGSIDGLIYLLGYPENVERLKSRFQPNLIEEKQVELISKTRFRSLTTEQIISLQFSCSSFELHPQH